MRVLVTGSTGKLGNAVVRLLADRDIEVVALARDRAKAAELLPEEATVAIGDVTDPDSLSEAFEGVEAVINCMGIFEQWVADQGEFDRVNAYGARNVVAAAVAAGAERLVHTSTYDVFDAPTGGTVTEERVATYPKGTPYERSKQRAERLVLEEAGDSLEVVIVNPAGVYGPGPWTERGWDGALRDTLRGRLPAVPPGGLTTVFADDAAAVHVAALDRGRPGHRYIAADGYAEVRELLGHAVEVTGRGRKPLRLPLPVAKGVATVGERIARVTGKPPLLAADQLHFFQWQARADASRARDELGVQFTDWREGIARTARWIIDSGRL